MQGSITLDLAWDKIDVPARDNHVREDEIQEQQRKYDIIWANHYTSSTSASNVLYIASIATKRGEEVSIVQ